MPNLWIIFTTGLLTGGVTCMAVQGGLLAAALASNQELGITNKGKIFGTISFLVSKLVAYTILGFLLGWLGSKVDLSLTGHAMM
ncbi:sulfite exporter TauE/SafE family protein, partial [Candidatus Amesbacteria bacterium]|nr:sulfite exporter TauE/SafE family protein [Candidatus Amesbacteria bacterium]